MAKTLPPLNLELKSLDKPKKPRSLELTPEEREKLLDKLRARDAYKLKKPV
jgi:hypothetical protein